MIIRTPRVMLWAACCSTLVPPLRLADFTQGDWGAFRDPEKGIMEKATTLVERCRILGLTLPSESTIKELVAVLACAHLPDATPQQLYGMVTELKAVGPRANSLARVASHGLQP